MKIYYDGKIDFILYKNYKRNKIDFILYKKV